MSLVYYIKYPSLQEIRKLSSGQAELIVNRNISTLENGINSLGELTNLGNVYNARCI